MKSKVVIVTISPTLTARLKLLVKLLFQHSIKLCAREYRLFIRDAKTGEWGALFIK